MPNSYIDYSTLSGNQLQGVFTPSTLGYVEIDDIYVTLTDDSAGSITTLTASQFTISTDPELTVTITDQTLLPLAVEDKVRVGRTTDINQLSRTFTDGSVLKSEDLNTQNNQFLYSIQEAYDLGVGGLAVQTDNTYDAEGRRIKNLGTPTFGSDAVTKDYLESFQFVGGGELPQSWVFETGVDDTIVGDDRLFNLISPVAASDFEDFYLVEVQGVIQVPGSERDFRIDIVGGAYILTLINGANDIAPGEQVAVRNFGSRRQVLSTPFLASNAAQSSFEIERLQGQTGDLLKAFDESEQQNSLFRIDADGQAIVGSGSVGSQDTGSLSGTNVQIGKIDRTGGTSVGDEYGVKLSTTTNSGVIEVGAVGAQSADEAIKVHNWLGNGSIENSLTLTYGGALTTSGNISTTATVSTNNLDVTNNATVGGDLTVTGSLNFGSGGVLQIIAIHEFTYQPPVNSLGNPLYPNANSSTSDYLISGIRLTVTPASSNSKFFVTGSVNTGTQPGLVSGPPNIVFADDMVGSQLQLHANASGSGANHLAVSNGTPIADNSTWSNLFAVSGDAYGSNSGGSTLTNDGPVQAELAVTSIWEPGTTSQQTLDVVHRAYRPGSAAYIFTSGRKTLYAVEYI